MKFNDALIKKMLCCLIVVVCLISLIPLVKISKYNVPSADDYGYATATFQAWNETHSIPAVLKAAFDTTVRYYNNWQGLYVSAFLLSLQPAIFGGKWYALTGVFMMAIILGSIVLFCLYFIKRVCKCDALDALTVGVVISTIIFQFMPSPVEGLYWFNGAVNYGFFFSIFLIYICTLIELQITKNLKTEILTFVICLLLAFLLEGGESYNRTYGCDFYDSSSNYTM